MGTVIVSDGAVADVVVYAADHYASGNRTIQGTERAVDRGQAQDRGARQYDHREIYDAVHHADQSYRDRRYPDLHRGAWRSPSQRAVQQPKR